MSPDDKLPDFSQVKDPMARMMLEQMRTMLEPLQATIIQLTATVENLRQENAELKRLLFGKKSERMPPMDREQRRRRKDIDPDKSRQQAAQKRKRNARKKKELPTEEVVHDVPEGDQVCPHCGGTRFTDLGEGEVSYE